MTTVSCTSRSCPVRSPRTAICSTERWPELLPFFLQCHPVRKHTSRYRPEARALTLKLGGDAHRARWPAARGALGPQPAPRRRGTYSTVGRLACSATGTKTRRRALGSWRARHGACERPPLRDSRNTHAPVANNRSSRPLSPHGPLGPRGRKSVPSSAPPPKPHSSVTAPSSNQPDRCAS